MARARSISSIENEISKVEAELTKVQEKCDALSARLLELQKLKQEYEAKQVMEAFRKSGKSMQELMTFLDV
jgi:cell fate (sporulation/competence/biofilm development) regulator YlbF (YheA/YmcA/DUF963 family)